MKSRFPPYLLPTNEKVTSKQRSRFDRIEKNASIGRGSPHRLFFIAANEAVRRAAPY
jgi:hypothetical protein